MNIILKEKTPFRVTEKTKFCMTSIDVTKIEHIKHNFTIDSQLFHDEKIECSIEDAATEIILDADKTCHIYVLFRGYWRQVKKD